MAVDREAGRSGPVVRWVIVAVVGMAAAAGGGYALGRSTGADLDGARTRGEKTGAARGSALGAQRGFAEGLKAGRQAGYDQTYRRAYKTAYKRATDQGSQKGDSARLARSAAGRDRTSSPEDYPLDAVGPSPRGMRCDPPFSYHMGICRIARPARPEECPPGQEPAGQTGACAPKP